MLTSFTDLRGKVWTYAYDSAGHLLSVLDPNGHYQARNTYDASTGRVTQQLDPLGDASTFSWDAPSQTATMTDAAGKQCQDVYSGNELVKRIDPLGHTYQYSYDNAGNLLTKTDPLGNVTTMTYDVAGNLLTSTSPAPFSYQQSWTYDSLNDLTSHTDAAGHATTYAYDSAGNLTSVTRPGSLVTTYTRDSSDPDLITAITDARGKTTTLGYDANGNLASSTDPLGDKTTFTYNSLGQQISVTSPRGNVTGANATDYTTTMSYDALGPPAERHRSTWPRNHLHLRRRRQPHKPHERQQQDVDLRLQRGERTDQYHGAGHLDCDYYV